MLENLNRYGVIGMVLRCLASVNTWKVSLQKALETVRVQVKYTTIQFNHMAWTLGLQMEYAGNLEMLLEGCGPKLDGDWLLAA